MRDVWVVSPKHLAFISSLWCCPAVMVFCLDCLFCRHMFDTSQYSSLINQSIDWLIDCHKRCLCGYCRSLLMFWDCWFWYTVVRWLVLTLDRPTIVCIYLPISSRCSGPTNPRHQWQPVMYRMTPTGVCQVRTLTTSVLGCIPTVSDCFNSPRYSEDIVSRWRTCVCGCQHYYNYINMGFSSHDFPAFVFLYYWTTTVWFSVDVCWDISNFIPVSINFCVFTNHCAAWRSN